MTFCPKIKLRETAGFTTVIKNNWLLRKVVTRQLLPHAMLKNCCRKRYPSAFTTRDAKKLL